jgi:hypothetical protein
MTTAPLTPAPTPRSTSHPPSGVLALVMGILGLTALPLIGAILAVVFGYRSRRETEAEPERYSDELGRVGRILGWIGIGVAAFGLFAALGAVLVLMPV